MRAEKQCFLSEQLFGRESIYKHSFERFEQDGKQDYYTSVREAERSRSRPRDYRSGIFN